MDDQLGPFGFRKLSSRKGIMKVLFSCPSLVFLGINCFGRSRFCGADDEEVELVFSLKEIKVKEVLGLGGGGRDSLFWD